MRYYPGLGLGDCVEDRTHQRPKHHDVVARRMNDDHGERKPGEVLLILQVAVNRKKNVELLCGELE